MGNRKFKYNINDQLDILPRSISIGKLETILKKKYKISRDSFYRDRQILLGSNVSIPSDRLEAYAIIFGCSPEDLKNYKVKGESIFEIIDKKVKIKSGLTCIALLFLVTSCASFFFTGNEVFTNMYVRDSSGCSFARAVVATNRLSRIGDGTLSFYLETGKHKISIPKMEMNTGHAHYIGKGVDGKTYTVTYLLTKNSTTIRVERTGTRITVSTENICVAKKPVKKAEW